jgi:hypothetical protein
VNIPFQFTFTATNQYGLLWNPWGNTSVPDDIANTFSSPVTPPDYGVHITGLSIMTPDGDARCILGYYDTSGGGTFTALYPIDATEIAGGGIVRDFGDGFWLPLSATKIPVLKYVGVSGGVVGGDIRIHKIPE